MFVGHVGLALAAKAKAPKLSLAWPLAATITLDLIWPIFLLLGIEQVAFGSATGGFDQLTFLHYPWTHSLAMSIAWGVVFYGLARWRGIEHSTAAFLGILVVSHWVLDWVTHAPDLPLLPTGGAKMGLGLWGSIPATFAVEGVLYLLGIWVYLRITRASDRIGPWVFWGFLILMLVFWAATPWSPPPPSVAALAGTSIVLEWLMLAWAWWVDRRRVTVAP